MSTRTERLALRASPEQKRLLGQAAEHVGTTLTEFILRAACERAENELIDRTEFVVSDERMAAFLEALERTPRVHPKLAAVLAEPSVFENDPR